jgi:putative ABC transport system permease protein
MTDAQVTKDLARPLGQSAQTLTMINGLLWLTAAGVIGSIIYMTALERQRDVAVLKATGASTRSLLGGLALEALVLAVTAAVIASLLALLLKPLFPFPVEIPPKAYVKLVVVAVVVGLIASAAGGRRISHVDPALAFGGA